RIFIRLYALELRYGVVRTSGMDQRGPEIKISLSKLRIHFQSRAKALNRSFIIAFVVRRQTKHCIQYKTAWIDRLRFHQVFQCIVESPPREKPPGIPMAR